MDFKLSEKGKAIIYFMVAFVSIIFATSSFYNQYIFSKHNEFLTAKVVKAYTRMDRKGGYWYCLKIEYIFRGNIYTKSLDVSTDVYKQHINNRDMIIKVLVSNPNIISWQGDRSIFMPFVILGLAVSFSAFGIYEIKKIDQ